LILGVCRLLPFSGTLLAVLVAANAWANDSTAELATGGLVLTTTADIEMRSEELFLSVDEIRVAYRFFNKTAQNKIVTVAFPMPDISVSGLNNNLALPTVNPENIFDFSTRADGQPVETRLEQRVFARGVDQTELLRKLGVPIQPELESTNKALDALPQSQWQLLTERGLAEAQDDGVGGDSHKHLQATWTLKATYYWEQTFPAQNELLIEHRYKPSVGRSAVTSLASPDARGQSWYQEYLRKYCLDKYFLGALENARKAENSDFPALQEQRIAYILKTAANWAAPIKSFRMVVDKGDPKNLVSFCGNPSKISPTQFEVKASNYTPTGNVDVLILTKK